MTSSTRQTGTDNPYSVWSPMPGRQKLSWPNGAHLAVAVVLSIEHLEWEPPVGAVIAPTSVGYGPYPAAFQIVRVSDPEYGSRVGAFRVLEALDDSGIRPMVAMDSLIVNERPALVGELVERRAEFLGHGLALSRVLHEAMPDAEQAALITQSLDLVERATGTRPVGWLGTAYAESTRTVRLLEEAGLRYVCDWPNDEQPFRMGDTSLVALPVAVDLDDFMAEEIRKLPAWRWSATVQEAAERLCRDGSEQGRLLVLNLHAHVSGQPFRIKYVTEMLSSLARDNRVWLTTGSEIIDWFLANDRSNA